MARQLTTYKPTSVWDFMSEVEKAFDDMWKTPGSSPAQRSSGLPDFSPAVDLHETPEFFLVSLDLPGIPQNDVKIDLQNGRLTVSGQRQREETREDGLFKRYERSHGSFTRSFQLPQNVDESKVQARMENGVLEIMIPKAEAAKSRSVQIEPGNKGGLFSKLLNKKTADKSTSDEDKH